MTAADLLLKIAASLSDLLSKSAALNRARDADLARLFDRIADALCSAAEILRHDEDPIAECSELFVYTQHLHMGLRKSVGFWGVRKLKHLIGTLEMATDAPQNAVSANLASRASIVLPLSGERMPGSTTAEEEIAKMLEAGGLFRAAANLIRVGARV